MYRVRLVRKANASLCSKKRIIELVYVLGTANTNHHPSPRRNPLPFAETRSRTMRPSKRATSTLRYVLATRKNV